MDPAAYIGGVLNKDVNALKSILMRWVTSEV